MIVLFLNGKEDKILNNFVPNKITDFYTILKGKTFVFEDVVPSTYMERYYKYFRRG